MTEIQRNIIKRGKRNAICRLFHKRGDNKAIATWRLDLNGILHVFNVRSLTSVRLLLTFRFQTELERNTRADMGHSATNTHAIVSHIHHDPPNADNIVSDVHHDVSNTRAVVSDIRPNTLKTREGTDSRNSAVSAPHTIHDSK